MADEQIIVDIRVTKDDIVNAKNEMDRLTMSIDNLSSEIKDARDKNKELNKSLKEGKISTEEYNKAVTKNNVEIAQSSNELRKLKNERNANINVLQNEKSAYDALSSKLNLARKEAKDLGAQFGITSSEFKNAAKTVNLLDNELKQIDGALGQHQRNVGNYGSVWQGVGTDLKNLFLGGGIVFAIQKGIGILTDFGKESIQAASDSQQAFARIEQAIITTGGAAGYTAEQLNEMAAGLQKMTIFEDDQILTDVTSQLLTFTNIAGTQFERAQKAALDMSTVLGKDLNGAMAKLGPTSIQIGKALNDPIKGITALSKAGVQFSEDQKAVIKSLVETGKVAEAQNMILNELEKEFGGQAKTMAESGLGPIEKLKNSWGDFKELIGGGLIGIINQLGKIAGDVLGKVVEWFQISSKYIVDFINGWIGLYNESTSFRLLIESISVTFTTLYQTVKLIMNGFIDVFKGTGKVLAYTFNPANWGANFGEGLKKIILENSKEVITDVLAYGSNVGNAFNQALENSKNGKKSLISLDDVKAENVKIIDETKNFTDEITQINSNADSEKTKRAEEVSKKLIEINNKKRLAAIQDETILKDEKIKIEGELLTAQLLSLEEGSIEKELLIAESQERIAEIEKEYNEKQEKIAAEKMKKIEAANEKIEKLKDDAAIKEIERQIKDVENSKATTKEKNDKIIELEQQKNEILIAIELEKVAKAKENKSLEEAELQAIITESEIKIAAIEDEFALKKKEKEAKEKEEQIIALQEGVEIIRNQLSQINAIVEEFAGAQAATFGKVAESMVGAFKSGKITVESAMKALQGSSNAIFDAIRERGQENLDENEMLRQKDLELVGDNKEAQDKINVYYDERAKEMKLKQFKIDKAQALVEIAISTAMAAVKALASTFPPLSFIAAGLAVAFGVAQGAIVAAQKPPTFGKGTSDIVSIGDSHASGNDVDVWGFSGGKRQFFGKVERGEAMPVIRKSAANDYLIAKMNGQFSGHSKTFANGTPDITQSNNNAAIGQMNSEQLANALSKVTIVAKIEDITKAASKKIQIVENSKF